MARVKSGHDHGFRSLAIVTETKLPKEGTKLRECYDFLYVNRGRRVKCPYAASMLRDLEDFYGCQIKRVPFQPRVVVLLGEWRGENYVDYLTDESDPLDRVGIQRVRDSGSLSEKD